MSALWKRRWRSLRAAVAVRVYVGAGGIWQTVTVGGVSDHFGLPGGGERGCGLLTTAEEGCGIRRRRQPIRECDHQLLPQLCPARGGLFRRYGGQRVLWGGRWKIRW